MEANGSALRFFPQKQKTTARRAEFLRERASKIPQENKSQRRKTNPKTKDERHSFIKKKATNRKNKTHSEKKTYNNNFFP